MKRSTAATARAAIWVIMFTSAGAAGTGFMIWSWFVAPLGAAAVVTVLWALVVGYIVMDWLAERG